MSITISITAPGINETRTFDWSDGNITRLLDWASTAYPTTNPDGTTTPANIPQQAFRRWARSLVDGTRDNIRNQEKVVAVQAVPNPQPIDFNEV